MKWDIKGRTALITGAARGFGGGLAEHLLEQGMNVALVGLHPDLMHAIAEKYAENALVIGADVASLEQMKHAVEMTTQRFGGIDVVVANAGIATVAPLAEIDPAMFRKVIDVNLIGVFNTLHASAPSVFAKQGYFLVVSSLAYAVNSPLQAHYTASKAGVSAMANSFRLEARTYGAEVGVIYSTFAKTDMMKDTHKLPGGREIWGEHTGIWRQIEPEQVVDRMVAAIKNRARTIVVPKLLWPVYLAPGIFQPILELYFSINQVKKMIAAFRKP